MLMDNAILFAWFSIGASEIVVSSVRMTVHALKRHRFDAWILMPPLEPIVGAVALTLLSGIYAVNDPPSLPYVYFAIWIGMGHTVIRLISSYITRRADTRISSHAQESQFWRERARCLERQIVHLERELNQR